MRGKNPWDVTPSYKHNVSVPAPLSTDFYTAIAQNRKRTFLLIFMMILMLGGLGYLTGLGFDAMTRHVPAEAITNPSPKPLTLALIAVAAGIIWTLLSLWRGNKIALRIAGARDISAKEAPQLHNIVQELSIAAGVPKPRVMIIESAAPNAFAIGYSHEKSAVGVTRGLLEMMDREELQGVIAHELAHIANYDTRYMTMTAIIVGLVLMVGDGLRHLLRMKMYAGGHRNRGRGPAIVILIVLMILVAVIVPLLAQLLKFAVSRQREYLADATAVRIARNKTGLINALDKLQNYRGSDPLAAKSLQHLYIVNPFKRMGSRNFGLFATHPATNDRINRLITLR